MKNNQKLIEQKNIYIGYLKVINLKRIKLQNEINNYKKQIAFVKGSIQAMDDIKKVLNKESNFLSFFEYGKQPLRPHLKNIFIFIQTSDNTTIGKYSDKKIHEFISKNVRKEKDSVFVIGERLFNYLKENLEGFIISFLGKTKRQFGQDFIQNFSILFDKVSEISFTLYSDNLVNKVVLLYSDIKNPSELFQFIILPFDLKQINKSSSVVESDMTIVESKEAQIANDVFSDFKFEKVNNISFISQVTSINESFLKLFLSSLSKYVVVNYLLNIALRKMLNFDEEEKNLEDRMRKNQIDLQSARNEAITNEMILTAFARKAITKKKSDLIFLKKKQEEQEYG